MSEDELIEELKKFVNRVGSQRQAAANLEISTAYLNDVLKRRRAPGPAIYEAFSLRRVITYVSDNGDWGDGVTQ